MEKDAANSNGMLVVLLFNLFCVYTVMEISHFIVISSMFAKRPLIIINVAVTALSRRFMA